MNPITLRLPADGESDSRVREPGRSESEPVRRVLERLERVRATGPARWTARCPAHEDRSPSLSLRETSDGKALLFCHAGCRTEAVVAALGLRMADLFTTGEPGGPATAWVATGGASRRVPRTQPSRPPWSDFDRIAPPDGFWPAYEEIVDFISQERAAARARQRTADRPGRREQGTPAGQLPAPSGRGADGLQEPR